MRDESFSEEVKDFYRRRRATKWARFSNKVAVFIWGLQNNSNIYRKST